MTYGYPPFPPPPPVKPPRSGVDLGISITPLGGAALSVSTLGFIVVDAHIDQVAAPQACSEVGDDDMDAVVQMTNACEAEMLPHA